MDPSALVPVVLAMADGAHAAAGDGHAQHAAAYADVGALPYAKAGVDAGFSWLKWMLLAPLVSVVLCGTFALLKVKGRWPAVFTVASFAIAAVLAVQLYREWGPSLFASGTPLAVPLAEWITFSWGDGPFQSFTANFGLYIDGITLLWMLFVTVLATLIALYASEYMESDVKAGYARFFFAVSLFVASMLILVMSDNLIGLYMGWEGVGLCSYMLIGYYAKQVGATAAAKKAFIMNRIGDLGLALAIFLIWTNYGTVQYDGLFQAISSTGSEAVQGSWTKAAIPFLLLLAVCGKSAQGPLFTWLPDAMWGPTPVSALIHAATMVTAGIYLLARMAPFYTAQAIGAEWAETALLTVGWIGCATAFIGATIACGQFDYKRVFAYSTISSLGYMVMGLGVGTAFGGVYYVFTHAWFKALLFLTAGAELAEVNLAGHSVHHGAGGQEQQGLEPRVGEDVVDAAEGGADAEAHHHVAEGADGRVGEHPLVVELPARDRRADEGGEAADPADGQKCCLCPLWPDGLHGVERRHAREQVDARGHHGGCVNQGGYRCWTPHSVREPGEEWSLRALTAHGKEQEERDRGL